jgi:hypothetical protein
MTTTATPDPNVMDSRCTECGNKLITDAIGPWLHSHSGREECNPPANTEREDPWGTPPREVTFITVEIRRAEAVRKSMQKPGNLSVADVALVIHYAARCVEVIPF